MIYLDNSATTKVHKEVKEAMLPFLDELYGNANSKYYFQAEEVKKAILVSREKVANMVNSNTDEVVFTSGATESNNMVLKGTKGDIITTVIEHSSVYNTCKFLETQGRKVTYLNVNNKGLISLKDLEESITSETGLVSIIWVNNEIGTIQDLEQIDRICTKKNVELHIDATAGIGKVDLDVKKYKSLAYITYTGHKIYAPKGIGCLIIKKDQDGLKRKLTPLIHGGETDEFGYRAGTLANHQIVGFGKACEIAKRDIEKNNEKLLILEKKFIEIMKSIFGDIISINNNFKNRVAGLISISFKGQNSQILTQKLSDKVACSTGSACSNTLPSRIIKSVGLNPKETIRFSLSHNLEFDDIEQIKGE